MTSVCEGEPGIRAGHLESIRAKKYLECSASGFLEPFMKNLDGVAPLVADHQGH